MKSRVTGFKVESKVLYLEFTPLTFIFLFSLFRDMENPFWHLSLKLHDRPKSVLPFPEDVEPGSYMVATIKQLVSAQLPDSLPDPELIGLSCSGYSRTCSFTLESLMEKM